MQILVNELNNIIPPNNYSIKWSNGTVAFLKNIMVSKVQY